MRWAPGRGERPERAANPSSGRHHGRRKEWGRERAEHLARGLREWARPELQ